jgi:hypothetical protein
MKDSVPPAESLLDGTLFHLRMAAPLTGPPPTMFVQRSRGSARISASRSTKLNFSGFVTGLL